MKALKPNDVQHFILCGRDTFILEHKFERKFKLVRDDGTLYDAALFNRVKLSNVVNLPRHFEVGAADLIDTKTERNKVFEEPEPVADKAEQAHERFKEWKDGLVGSDVAELAAEWHFQVTPFELEPDAKAGYVLKESKNPQTGQNQIDLGLGRSISYDEPDFSKNEARIE